MNHARSCEISYDLVESERSSDLTFNLTMQIFLTINIDVQGSIPLLDPTANTLQFWPHPPPSPATTTVTVAAPKT